MRNISLVASWLGVVDCYLILITDVSSPLLPIVAIMTFVSGVCAELYARD